jgi:hypothetical protein
MTVAKLLIPVKKYTRRPGSFSWPAASVLTGSAIDDLIPLQQLAADIGHKYSIKTQIVFDVDVPGPASLHIRRSKHIRPDAYQINITKKAIEITAATSASVYYAIQTLRDIVALEGRKLRCCIIEDWPDFKRRGVYHDCSRGKVPTLKTLKELVERLAHWKINELQLYIENVFSFKRHPAIGRGYSPFTAEEILALQDFCKKHHVRLVGSLASFGHMEKILMLPEYRHLGEMPGFRGYAGGMTLCPTDRRSIKLIDELYEEFAPLFEAVDFNVCGDEPWELGKGRSKKRAERIGAGRLYLEYFKKLYRLCQKYGKRMNAWADIILEHPELLAEVPKDAVMLNWDYNVDGERIGRTKEIAEAGLSFMACPGTSSWNAHGTRLLNAMGNIAQFAAQGLKYGAEGLLNTDWGDNGHRNFLGVSLHGFAYGAAHSWNSKGVDDKTFTERFCKAVFGMEGKRLARAMRLLGSTYLTCGAPYRNECALFYALTEPIQGANTVAPSRIDATSVPGLKKILSQLSEKSIWPAIPKGLAEFESLALRELELAAEMDCLAVERTLAAKQVRNGKMVAAATLRNIARKMHHISQNFESLWMVRNKPSRLRDNLALFKRIENESLEMSRR